MAAIIAQLTRAARARRDKRTYGTNKCMYTLGRFDPNGFNPEVHNRYCVEKARWEKQKHLVMEEEEIIHRSWKEYMVRMWVSQFLFSHVLLHNLTNYSKFKIYQ